jgi:putative two-component system response regulator
MHFMVCISDNIDRQWTHGKTMEPERNGWSDMQRPSEGSGIMVVDDQPANLKLMEDMLRRQGYAVRSFPRGRLALAAAAEEPPDLILLDIDMPEMNGFEVCKRLKSDNKLASIPVIFLSALNEAEDKVHAFRCGGLDYITKPFRFEEVQARVATHLHIHHLRRSLQVHNDQLEEAVRRRTREIEESRLEILCRLAIAAEYRDDTTGKHTERVGRTAAMLAQELQMPDLQVRMIRLAAPLHDVGKIGVPDRILLKKGKLSAGEFEVVKKHVQIGAKILSGSQSPLLQMAETIALYHHECWDGTGYSAGLAAERIPLPARVVAVADIFDALTHARCYKRAWPVDEAMREIWSQRGRRLDAMIVGALHKLVSSGRLPVDDRGDCQIVKQVDGNFQQAELSI